MAVSHDALNGIHRLNASGDVLTGYIPCSMIVWDARELAVTLDMVLTDSTGVVVLADTPDIASQHIGVFYPKRVIHNPTAKTLGGGAIIIYEASREQDYNW